MFGSGCTRYTEANLCRETHLERTVGRKLLWAYALLMLLAAIGYARYDLYMMDGDGTAFLDIAQDLQTHHAALAINAYWNPGYPAVLAVVERLVHPSLWCEVVLVRYTNVVIFALAMAACLFFTTGLTRARGLSPDTGASRAIPADALHLLGMAMLTLSMGRELPIAAPRADTLLLVFLLLAGGLITRLLVRDSVARFAALGLTLGCAYLTKSFAFLPGIALFGALFLLSFARQRDVRGRWLLGTLAGAALFFATSGPYIAAISRQLGHLSTGESARLNYAFFIDMTPRWHEWYHHDLGHAGGVFTHAETPLAASPPVFSYAAHPYGTFPLWFDPAWWTSGLKPHIWIKGHIFRFTRNVVVFFRYLLGRPEIFVLLAVLLAFGCFWPRRKGQSSLRGWQSWLWAGAPIAWGLLMFGIYLPIDLQDRYLTGPLLLLMLPAFALLSTPAVSPRQGEAMIPANGQRQIASALIVLFAGITISQAATYLADRRRHTPPAEQGHPGFDPQIFTAAAALDKLGLRPGDKVACMGDLACYTDFYWARLAGTQILGEVETPGKANPITVWNSIPDKRTVTAPLANMGLRYIVSLFPNSETKPQGWIELGGSNFFAYPLQGAIDPATAAEIENFKATP